MRFPHLYSDRFYSKLVRLKVKIRSIRFIDNQGFYSKLVRLKVAVPHAETERHVRVSIPNWCD